MTEADARGRPTRDALVRRGRLLRRVTIGGSVACFVAFAGLAATRTAGGSARADAPAAAHAPRDDRGGAGGWTWGDPASGGAQLGGGYSAAPPVARSSGS